MGQGEAAFGGQLVELLVTGHYQVVDVSSIGSVDNRAFEGCPGSDDQVSGFGVAGSPPVDAHDAVRARSGRVGELGATEPRWLDVFGDEPADAAATDDESVGAEGLARNSTLLARAVVAAAEVVSQGSGDASGRLLRHLGECRRSDLDSTGSGLCATDLCEGR